MSMPTSAIAATAAVDLVAGSEPPDHATPVPGQAPEPTERHLGPPRVVHAEEQHGGLGHAGPVVSCRVDWGRDPSMCGFR